MIPVCINDTQGCLHISFELLISQVWKENYFIPYKKLKLGDFKTQVGGIWGYMGPLGNMIHHEENEYNSCPNDAKIKLYSE